MPAGVSAMETPPGKALTDEMYVWASGEVGQATSQRSASSPTQPLAADWMKKLSGPCSRATLLAGTVAMRQRMRMKTCRKPDGVLAETLELTGRRPVKRADMIVPPERKS
jgi:hypothetical protein